MTPQTDIIIGFRSTDTYNTEIYMRECVDSVVKYTSNYRFIFIDDNSDQRGRDFISNLADSFRDSILIRTHFQRWFTRTYNIGLRLVRTPRAVCLNSDVVVGEGWLDELYNVWEEADVAIKVRVGSAWHKIGLIGSALYAPQGPRWAFTYQHNHTSYVTGHCWLVSMEAFSHVADRRGTPGWYLDETDPLNIHIRSDVDISWKLNEAGWGTVISAHANVGHVAGKSWGHNLWSIPRSVDQVNERYIGMGK